MSNIKACIFDLDGQDYSKNVDICRWGGEEFVFMFCNDDIDSAFVKVENLRKTIENKNFVYENKIFTLR